LGKDKKAGRGEKTEKTPSASSKKKEGEENYLSFQGKRELGKRGEGKKRKGEREVSSSRERRKSLVP